MKFWQSISFSEIEQYVEIAKIAEEVGFEGAFLSDHLVFPERFESRYPYSEDGKPDFDGATQWPDCFAAISAMAVATTRLRFATLIHILPLRHPFEVAKAVATASVLSGGRVALGAGAGWVREEFDMLGVEFESRGRRMDESIEAMRLLWSGDMVEYHGEFFDFPRVQMTPPPPGPVPIWIGGANPRALRRAAQRCDGWLGAGNTLADALAIADELTRLRSESDRQGEPFEIVAPLFEPPTPDVVRQLEDHGVTGTVSFPFFYSFGPTSTIEQKRAVMEQFSEGVIRVAS